MLINIVIDCLKDYLHKSIDAGIGMLGTGIIISVANSSDNIDIAHVNWGALFSGACIGVLMLVRAFTTVRSHIIEMRHKKDIHNKKMGK